MKLARPALGACALLMFLAGCQTTGDPRQGGLFGWSESKARARQREMRAEADLAEADLAREKSRGADLSQRRNMEREKSARTQAARRKSAERLAAAHEAANQQLARLKDSSMTAASDSRARAFATEIETIAGRKDWSPDEKTSALQQLEAEIKEALKGQPPA